MVGVDTRTKSTAVHAANTANRPEQESDNDPLTAVPLEHGNRIDTVPGEVAEPIPMPARVRRLHQAHNIVERRLDDATKRMVTEEAHEDKIHITRVKSISIADPPSRVWRRTPCTRGRTSASRSCTGTRTSGRAGRSTG